MLTYILLYVIADVTYDCMIYILHQLVTCGKRVAIPHSPPPVSPVQHIVLPQSLFPHFLCKTFSSAFPFLPFSPPSFSALSSNTVTEYSTQISTYHPTATKHHICFIRNSTYRNRSSAYTTVFRNS